MLRKLQIGLIVSLLLVNVNPRMAKAAPLPEVSAQAAVLMDFTTGQILYQKKANVPCPPASTTKILTALVALERGELQQKITTSNTASRTEGSSIYLSAGETHTLEDLLYGVLLSSGNDAALTVAEGLAGSEAKFVAWMNEKAAAIGAGLSSFKNCNGLPKEGHYTTAGDLALITRYALHNPVFDTIVKTKKKNIDWPGRDFDKALYNHNKLLWRYQYADGVKTGYTREAGKCLVSSATKNGQRLIAVLFNSKYIYDDSVKLFNYGFANFQLINIVSRRENLGDINVVSGIKDKISVVPNRSLTMLLKKGMETDLKVALEMEKSIEAPVERLQQVGEVQVKLGDELLETVPVVTAESVPRKGLIRKFWDWVKGLFAPINISHNNREAAKSMRRGALL
jgi:D-alanyl-D-alanine carboxypeptidase (penicillin-binding protein 5/6)